jgi:hypothetical protein
MEEEKLSRIILSKVIENIEAQKKRGIIQEKLSKQKYEVKMIGLNKEDDPSNIIKGIAKVISDECFKEGFKRGFGEGVIFAFEEFEKTLDEIIEEVNQEESVTKQKVVN